MLTARAAKRIHGAQGNMTYIYSFVIFSVQTSACEFSSNGGLEACPNKILRIGLCKIECENDFNTHHSVLINWIPFWLLFWDDGSIRVFWSFIDKAAKGLQQGGASPAFNNYILE